MVLCISVDVSQDYSQVENVIKQVRGWAIAGTHSLAFQLVLPVLVCGWELTSISGTLIVVVIDVLQSDSSLLLLHACSHKFFQAQEKLGPVDMLVNCAGMSLSGKFEDLEVSTFEVSSHLLFSFFFFF